MPDWLTGLRRARRNAQHEVQQGDQHFLVQMQEAVIARPPEALGQNVLQRQVQEVGTGQRADLKLVVPAVPATKADQTLPVRVTGEKVSLPDHPAIEVAAKIDECLVTVADVSWMDKPMRKAWKKRGAVGMIESEQEIKDKIRVERRY